MLNSATISIVAALIALASLIVSIKNYHFTKQIQEENLILKQREIISDRFAFYIELYEQEFKKIKPYINELSSLLVGTNTQVGEIFDIYDNHYSYNTRDTKALRHIYDLSHTYILEYFNREISWQSPENIYDRLAGLTIRGKTHELNEHLSEYEFNFSLLHKAVDNKIALISDFRNTVIPVIELFNKLKPELSTSLENLENGIHRNGLEEFKLSENYVLYRRYLQLLNLLKFILQSRIHYYGDEKNLQYLRISDIVFNGASLSIINRLACNVLFDVTEAPFGACGEF